MPTLEEDYENKRKKKKNVYVREQMVDTIELDLQAIGNAKQIPLSINSNVFVYVIQMPLENEYKMVSVYVHNNDKDGGDKDFEKVMFQVELNIYGEGKKPIFVPEYICRKKELEDEYYYKGRPVYGRGRGCAAMWNKRAEEQYAYQIKSSFMQNRYSGDIGDFSKLGLLRALLPSGLTIGINWYLVPDETHNSDGRHVKYLEKDTFMYCDRELWKELGQIVHTGKRNVKSL